MLLFPDSPRDAVALDDGVQSRTFAELEARIGVLGALLRDELGLAAGERVAWLGPNRVEGVELVLAAIAHGLVVVPISHHLAADEIAYVLADSGARLLVSDAKLPSVAGGPSSLTLDALESRLAGRAPRALEPDGPPGTTLIYTSGTSGRPKGVRRAGAATLSAQLDRFRDAGRSFGFDGAGPHLVTGPLYHAAPLLFAVYDLLNGAPMIVMPRWDERAFLALVARHHVAHTHLVPTMMVRLLRLPEHERSAARLDSLTLVMHGAAPITQETKRGMVDWLGDRVVEYWGATEGGIYTLCGAREWLARPGTVGRPLSTWSVTVVDDEGRPRPEGETGTLVCTHATLDRPFEYFGDEEKTAGCYRGPRAFTVGDLGHVDRDGYVYLSERRTNLILSGGVNIYPAEIERVLAMHPAVLDVAVLGLPDAEWGERVHAAVELAPSVAPSDALRDELLRHARAWLAGFKVPRSLDFHAKLPRTEAGKMRVRDLLAHYAEARAPR